MVTRLERIRGKQGNRPEAVLAKYVDMSNFKFKEYNPAEWECMKCHSNSLLPIEYGCSMCQPFVLGAKLSARKYK